MPLDLPGFYWDAQRNRYFPISSKPKEPPLGSSNNADQHLASSPTLQTSSTGLNRKRKRKSDAWNVAQSLLSSCSQTKRYRAVREILSTNYSQTSRSSFCSIPTRGSKITSVCSTSLNGMSHHFVGDNAGWIYTSRVAVEDGDDRRSQAPWSVDMNLHPDSKVSSISISGSRCIATCFGPAARVFVQDLNALSRTSLLTIPGEHDVRAAHLEGNSLVLGASKKVLFLEDIDASLATRKLRTQSDVFSVCQCDNSIYAGTRSGSILRFDKRMPTWHGQHLFPGRPTLKEGSTVLFLQNIIDSQLLVSYMNGDLQTYDLRYAQKDVPVVRYPGHSNHYLQNLGIALDPEQEFLFAAGDDSRIRGWSVKMGDRLTPHCDLDARTGSVGQRWQGDVNNPLLYAFPDPVDALHVSQEREGPCLWVGNEGVIQQFYLGQRGLFSTL